MEKNGAIELALTGRSALYRAFHTVFGGEPTADALQMLAGEDFGRLAAAFVDEGDAAALLQRAASGQLAGGQAALEGLQSAYLRLFVGPGNPEAAPWETVYVGAGTDRALFGPVTLEARRAYVAQGLIPQGYPNVSDDHVALELDFMRMLGERALEAYGAGDAGALRGALEASASFLREHVLRWTPGFAAALAQARHGALYREAAAALKAFAACDARLVEELLAAVA